MVAEASSKCQSICLRMKSETKLTGQLALMKHLHGAGRNPEVWWIMQMLRMRDHYFPSHTISAQASAMDIFYIPPYHSRRRGNRSVETPLIIRSAIRQALNDHRRRIRRIFNGRPFDVVLMCDVVFPTVLDYIHVND